MAALEISGGFIIAGLVLIVVFFIIVLYNGLITLRNNADKAWANIDVLLKKRLDLIPTLVDVVKSYAAYEQGVLVEVTRIRAAAMQAQGIAEKARRNEEVNTSLGSVFAVAENYPDLKASEQYLNLQKQITAIETQIAQRREFYNDSVLLYNTNISTIPGVFIANQLRFQPREYFRVDGDVETPVKVAVSNM
jgi:LemA protein